MNQVEPFSKSEIDCLISNTDGYMKNFIQFMYSTGIRPGEIISLTWKDINYDKKQISVYKTMVGGKLGDTKTYSSNRKVDMLPVAQKALESQYKLTKDSQFIFMTRFNKPFYSHDIINTNFNPSLPFIFIKPLI